ncbi:hypothetical protein BW723_11650 [Polaribacter reichenbachii]|uniref:Interferon-induced transmembrane protein n=1 Tax=Polaribacter reichenbachii TaxID=996801 RepID=A0A1B8TPQ2_9FLAO|nr:CCC motif membrane protein [Polaribacter reichenbachii]APZ46897.1 hypothetical protein BW723_11650 [Polaribacter reichenbachii]AUC17540.1 hypothetical protein BTO17_02095 [Polaribacter reichenbachii]OBY61586.1 hypothetical protein LPB301_16125 [Polaribacter reichenbachii]
MKKLNTTLIYVLSSVSLLCCCFFGLGILLALPSFLIANKKFKEATQYPEEFDAEEVKAMSTARTFALVALAINGLWFIYSVYSFATMDTEAFWEEFNKRMEEYQ